MIKHIVHNQGKPKTWERVGKFQQHKVLLLFIKKATYFMKRSKVFLGVTTCILAIAGVAAAKAKFTGLVPYYFTAQGNSPQGNCIKDPILTPPAYQTSSTTSRLTTIYGSGPSARNRSLYETSTCLLPVYSGTL
jgi:hypothetical protein